MGIQADIESGLFDGPGEMRARCRELDWSSTALGGPESWTHALRSTVSTLLASRHPMFFFWGPGLIQFYNDAYRPSLAGGGCHPIAADGMSDQRSREVNQGAKGISELR